MRATRKSMKNSNEANVDADPNRQCWQELIRLLEGNPEFEQRFIALGRALGVEAVHDPAFWLGLKTGAQLGQLHGARDVLVRVFTRRNLKLTPPQRMRIDACTSLGTLHRWFDQALTAHSTGTALS